MSEFNVDEYFANRSKAFKTPDGSDFINDKYLELQQTTQNKVRELAERSSLAAKQEAVDADTWVGKLDLAPHSLQGNVVNVVGSAYQGATGVAGRVLSAAPSALVAANQANLSEDDIAALNRHQQGQSTPEDLARINRKVAPIVAPTPGMPRDLAQAHANERAQFMADMNPNAPTPLKIWAEMNKAREISRGINESADNSSVVRLRDQAALGADLVNTYNDASPQIAKGWEDLKAGSELGGSADIAVGVAKLLYGGISDIAGNKQATLEHIAQNAPQLLIGLFGKAGAMAQLVDNVSAAADSYNKGILDYQAKNGGALPPEAQRQEMAMWAAAHVGAEMMGDKIGLAATKLGGEVVKDISKASFKAALKGTATAVGEGLLSEAPTEAFQQFAEGEIAGKPATGAEIFSAGVIGGASGSGLSGGGRAVHEAAKLAAQPSPAKQETIDQAKVQAAAIASGDVSSIKDPVNQIAALFGHSQKADTTQGQKQTNLAKANEIVAALETQYETVQQEAKTSTVAGVKELIAERQAQLADPETAKDPARVALLTQSLELAQADLADLEASKDQKVVETAVQKKLADITQQLQEAKTAKDNLAVLVQSKDTIEADIALISTPKEANDALAAGVAPRATAAVGVSKEQTAAADRIITLAMTAPERLDTKVVAALAADTNNALTAPQRAYLSAFLRAQQSNPTLTSSHVAKDIYKGEYGNKGVLQFRTAMGKALAAGNQKMADAELTGKFGIFNFVQAHQNKADVAAQAIERGVGTSILKENGQWVVGKPGVGVTPEQHKAGGRTITSGRLALAIKEEAQALSDVAAEMQAAYDLKFGAPAKVVDKAKPAPVVVASTEKAAEVTATQATNPHKWMYHGTRAADEVLIQPDGSLLLKPSRNMGGKTFGVSFTHDVASATDYATRIKGGGPNGFTFKGAKLLKIASAALENIEEETFGEWADYTGKPVVIPKGSFSIIPVEKTKHLMRDSHLDSAFREWFKDSYSSSEREELYQNTDWESEHQEQFLDELMEFADEYSEADIAEAQAILRDQFGRKEKAVARRIPRSGDFMTPLDIKAVLKELSPVEAADPKVTEAILMMDRVQRAELERHFTEWTPEQTKLYWSGELEAFSRLSGYTENEITDWKESERLLAELGQEYGDDFARELNGSVQRHNGKMDSYYNKGLAEETPGSSVNTEVTQSTESTKEEGKSTAEVTQPAGTLEALATKSPEGTPFNERELLADNFKQSAGKALVDVKNFLSSLIDTATEQHPAVQSFIKHAQAWNKTITLNLPKVGERSFRYEDMMRFLITDTDGVSDIEENVKTAISYAVYQYVASEATSPQYHKDSAINSILGRQKDEWVSPSARETLAHVGMGQDRLIDSLGGAIMDVLGFKANDDAGQELASKLRAALGAHALKLMEDRKLVQGYVVSGPDMQKLREEGLDDHGLQRLSKAMGTANTKVAVTFFAIARNTEAGNDTAGKVTARVERIYQDTRGSQDALGKLFKAEPSTKIPSLVPVTDVAKVTAGTNQGVPDEQRDALEVMQSREHFVREDTLDLLSEFGEEFLHSMMGVVEEENATVHRANRISVKAKNDGLRREWANFQEYVGEYLATSEKRLKTPFFFKFSPWKQQRTGIDNTAVNPQTSKIARALVTSARWESEIALDNKELMDSFYLGVAEGLGVKTERQDNQLSVDAIIDTLATPIYADAVEAIRKRMIHKESLSDQEKDAVLLAVAKGGANLHSLDALIGMAYHAEAVATKATTFVSRVYREVDGVANGTMLNHALLGAAENPEALAAILEHGGFFEEGSQYTHYSAYRGTQGNKDIYEKTGQMVYEEVMAAVGGMDSLVISSIWAIGGELFDPKTGIVSKAGRNLVKDGMNPLSFGSALESVVKGMADTFADSVYTGFEKLAAKQALPDEINDYVMSVNALLDKKHHIPMNKPMQWHMDNVFSNQARTNITNSFSSTVGQITSAVLEREFAVFLERRNALNGTAQAVSGMYDALYRGIREDYVNQLIASGDIVAEHGADRTADLSKEQEAELTKKLSFVAPVLRTAMSKNDRKGNGTRTGLLMAKTKRKMSNDPAYKNVSKFGTPFADRATSDTRYSTARKAKSLTLRGFSKQYETIGVAIGSAATHSTDSRIMLMVQKVLDVLGIHDAAIDGVAGAKETANLLNSNTWESLLNYSPLEEVYLSTANMIQGMAQIIQNGGMPPQSITYLKEFLAKEQWKYGKGINVLGAILNGAKQVAHQADTVKLGFMSTAGVIDQYAFQGGQYQVTQTNRDEAAQNLKKLSDKIPKEISDALAVVQAALKAKPAVVPRPNSPVEEAAAPTAETDEEGQFDVVGEQLDELPKGPATSPFGVVGKPTTKSDPALVKFFKENPKATAKQTIKFLYDKLTADKGAVNRDFNLKLLKLLLKTVPAGLTVNLVTKDTKAEDVYGMPSSPALGWYPAGAQEEVVYIVGTDFTQSNMQVEVLLHELTHAATSYRLFATAGAAQRKELSDLLDTVSKYTEANGITKFDAALTDVDELVAYGMTSPAFQKLLAQIPVGQSTNKVSDALQKFVGILARLLGFEQTSDAKALGVLITNVAALMEQGAKEKTELEGRTLSMAAPTNTYSTIDIHEALADGSLTEEFDEHLRSLLGGIVYNLHGAFGSFKESLMKNQALDATDVWLKALNTGVAPFASEALGHIATTPQVAYALEQVEATVRAALETNESQTKMVYKELYKLYGEAEGIVTVQSLIDAGLDAATAQATHDMLFKLEQGADNRSNYLARFAALGLAHPVINQVLQASTANESRKARDGKTFMERLEVIFENIMKMFRTYVTHTYQGQPANDKLLSLVGQLVDIEAKYQRKIDAKANTSNILEPIEAKLKVFVEAAGAKIEAVAGSNFVRNNKYTAVKLAGGLVGTIAGGRADLFMEGLFRLRAETFKKRFGVVASLAQAYVGQNVVFQGLLRMTKLLEHDRQKEVAGWAKTALEAYVDNGKMLRGKSKDSVAARASITSVFMRTGAHNLMGDFDMAGIEQLVTSKAALDTAITSFESKLAVHGRAAPYYVNQANALGYKLATGIARTKFVNQNAHAISRLSGTGQESKVSTAQAEQAEATLKVLVTLYALRYSDSTAVGHAARVIKAENARADKMNGLEMTLLLQKRLETESLERLFGNNPMLMVHGYTSEIYDPNVTIKTANVLEGKALLEQGYVKRSEVPRDPADNDQDVKHLYVLQDGGVPRFVSGAMSNRGMQAKGTTIHNGYTNAYNATGIANASQNATLMQDRRAAIADMFRPGPVKDLSKEKGSYLVPVFNEAGNVTNWRYMMAESTKDNVLNRNNRFDKVLGTIAGSIYDKETSREQNMTVVKALHDQFKTDYQSNPKSYINIGPKSEDPEMKEIWNLLPDDTRKDIREVWGHNGMTVKVENLDIVFGYRKLSVGTIFTKANEERDARKLAGQRTEVMALKTIDAWQKLIVMLFEFPLVGTGLKQGMTMEEAKKYARKAGANAVRTEHIWQAIVSETKDIIVVKSGLVLLGNMSSNIWLLGMSGVPILDVMHHHLVAWKGAVSWKKDTEELEHLKRLRATGYTQGNKADIDRRILRLEDSLDRNPVKELVEAGLMPTIVEDIDPEDDLYSYKSHLVRKVEGYTDKMNPTVVKAARTAYLAHDTPIYQAMSQMTRLSDFMARYTMYQHLISKKEPLSKQEATQKVSEAFINYDIALHRSIQYTDDMGITMFTKYFIGIQKVLLDTMRENPARVLTGVLLSKFLGLGPTVLDGSMWNHIGNNPFRTGPFELLDALDELPMINAPLALLNMGGSPAP